jgi:subtilase family serine protease
VNVRIAVSLVALSLAGLSAATPAAASPTLQSACGTAAPMHARCLAVVRSGAVPLAATDAALPAGFGPADLQDAYKLPVGGAGQTIAVVDAYDDPTAEDDLATYRATYGLPPCTTAGGCFRKLNQAGKPGPYPQVDGGWAVETSLDLDMVSASCPLCHVLLVEGNSSLVSDLAASVDTAVKQGGDVVSNSYGLAEFNGMQTYAKHYKHNGHVIVASSGDAGFTAAQFPAVTPGVLAVGGTSLVRADNGRGWSESAWSGAGSGCSAYVKKPAYQTDDHCLMRTIADVSAVADPNTGLAVYDTTPNPFGIPPGWLIVGGTSASAPFIAGVIGLAGNAATYEAGYSYAHTSALFDPVGGSNGFCGGDYLCTGTAGYDGPTGAGSPDGVGAF